MMRTVFAHTLDVNKIQEKKTEHRPQSNIDSNEIKWL